MHSFKIHLIKSILIEKVYKEKRISYILMNFLAIGFIAFVIAFPIMNINSNQNKATKLQHNISKGSKNEKFIKMPKQRNNNFDF